jgi:hypothetical protein
MSKTFKNDKGHSWRDPSWYRRMQNRLYRARMKQLLREGKYDIVLHPKRVIPGWYW